MVIMEKVRLRRDNGSRLVTRDEIMGITPPVGTRTHVPLAHGRLLDGVTGNLERSGIEITREEHSITKDEMSYFGLLHLRYPGDRESAKEYGMTVGIRNNNSRLFPAQLVAGSNTFVCDNGCFWGETKISRRHTVNMEHDLYGMIDQAISKLNERKVSIETRMELYKEKELSPSQAHDFVIRAYDSNVIGATRIPKVIEEFRNPRHKEFRDAGKTLYTMLQAFTEIQKAIRLEARTKPTMRLTGMLDKEAGILPMNPVLAN